MKLVQEIKDYAFITLGLFLYSFAVTFFMLPYKLTTGGVTGVAAIIFYATGFEVQNSYLIINAIFLLAAVKVLGLRFCMKTIYAVCAMSFILWALQRLAEDPVTHELPILVGDQTFMACVIGAALEGIGLAICFMNNGSTGGTDIIAAIVNKYKNISLGQVIMLCDVVIISSCYFVFHDWERVVFGFALLFISSTTLDYVLNRSQQSVQFMIFSRNYSKIADAINSTGRGVTVLDGIGWFTKTERKVIVVLVRRRESVNILRMIKSIDPYAFVSMGSVSGVYGEGFDEMKVSKIKKGKKTLVFASNNAHKLEEMRAMLGDNFEIRSLSDIGCYVDIPETAGSFQGNALQKARFVKKYYGFDCFADDTGLECAALNGAPGIYSARYASIDDNQVIQDVVTEDGTDATPSVATVLSRHDAEKQMEKKDHDSEENIKKLLRNLDGKIGRTAQFRTVIALIYNGEETLFEGIVRGRITEEKHGDGGFGYDSVFVPEGYDQTFAELGSDVKNGISHRAKAMEKLVNFLNKPKTDKHKG